MGVLFLRIGRRGDSPQSGRGKIKVVSNITFCNK